MRLAHTLKGVAYTLGASDLGDAALELEQTLSSRNLESCHQALDKLLICLGTVRHSLDTL